MTNSKICLALLCLLPVLAFGSPQLRGATFVMKEIWENIIGFEGYQVSTNGNVRKGKKSITLSTDTSGYHYVCLIINKIRKNHLVHRLVARAFIGESQLTVNHKNFTKTDNRLENLEYLTQRNNRIHYALAQKRKLPIGVQETGQRFRAGISLNGKRKHIGVFDTPQEANIAYLKKLHEIEKHERNHIF